MNLFCKLSNPDKSQQMHLSFGSDENRRLATTTDLFVLVAGCLFILHIGRSFLLPLLTAAIAVYLVHILSRLIQRIRIYRYQISGPASKTVSFLLIFGLLYFFAGRITEGMFEVSAVAPLYQARLQQLLSQCFQIFGVEHEPDLRELIRSIDLRGTFSLAARTLLGSLSLLTLVFLYGLFGMLELRFIPAKLAAIFPNSATHTNAVNLLRRIDRDVQTYLGVKTAASVLTALLSYVVMRMVGLNSSEISALLIFVLNFIPVLGPVVATIFPTLIALLQFDNFAPALIVGIVISAIQQAIGSIIEPAFVGQRLNLSPLAVVMSLVFWGNLWGIIGAFLCVPLTTILVIILANFQSTRWVSILLSQTGVSSGESGDPTPKAGNKP